MKLSISNIAWDTWADEAVYEEMQKLGFSGLEIAPTRIFPEQPYCHLEEAMKWACSLKRKYGLGVSSMQSIWYGRAERLFGTEQEREILMGYTRDAVDFAKAVGCKNLVFGCPKNRNVERGVDPMDSLSFFRKIGDYAARQGIVLALEANPTIYHTNFINTTTEAVEIAKLVHSEGIQVNLDLGTVIYNREALDSLRCDLGWFHHIHVSEPDLRRIRCRAIHRELKSILNSDYRGYLSIEMGKGLELEEIFEVMREVRDIFYEV